MAVASDRQEYERAAIARDKIRAIERTMESQKMAAFASTELDLSDSPGRTTRPPSSCSSIRDGKMIGRDVFLLDAVREATDDEVLGSFLEQYYARATSIPREIYVPKGVTDTADLETFLAEKRGGPVHLRMPQRGEKRDLMDLASRNAAETLAREQARWLADQGKTLAALEELADALDLAGHPGCASSATTSATSRAANRSAAWSSSRTASRAAATTAGSGSRRSRARTTSPATRRSCAAGSGCVELGRRGERGGAPLGDARPGHHRRRQRPGQRREGRSSTSSGLHDLPLAGLAKEREELFLPGRPEPVVLPSTSSALYLVQRLRDEAHRFAITYHRTLRDRRTVRSAFDDLPGVGPKRKRELLKVFGSIKRVREAPVEQIAAVPGIGRALAARIKAALEA